MKKVSFIGMFCLCALHMIGKWMWSHDSFSCIPKKLGMEVRIHLFGSIKKEDISSEVLLPGIVHSGTSLLSLEEYLEE